MSQEQKALEQSESDYNVDFFNGINIDNRTLQQVEKEFEQYFNNLKAQEEKEAVLSKLKVFFWAAFFSIVKKYILSQNNPTIENILLECQSPIVYKDERGNNLKLQKNKLLKKILLLYHVVSNIEGAENKISFEDIKRVISLITSEECRDWVNSNPEQEEKHLIEGFLKIFRNEKTYKGQVESTLNIFYKDFRGLERKQRNSQSLDLIANLLNNIFTGWSIDNIELFGRIQSKKNSNGNS